MRKSVNALILGYRAAAKRRGKAFNIAISDERAEAGVSA
jgi:hypothetical protein